MAIQKFFTIHSGIVGTAHTSREGKEVDFRPVRLVIKLERLSDKEIWDQPDEKVIEGFLARAKVRLQPAEGVQCEPIVLTPITLDHTITVIPGGTSVHITRAVAFYEGTEVQATEGGYFYFASHAGRQAKAAAEAEALRLRHEKFAAVAALTPAEVISLGHPVYSLLRHDQKWRKEAERLKMETIDHFGLRDWSGTHTEYLPDWMQKPETIRSRILEEKDSRRPPSGSVK